jgi:uncharacterized protein YndB with AHSA1/START domain
MAEVVCEVLIDAQPSTVFELLTDPELQRRWFGTEVTLDPRPGGIYKTLVAGTHPALGEFIEVVPDERVVFSFGWDEPDHPIPAGSTTVAITLTPEGAKTRVRLVHSGLPEDAVSDHTQGWNHYLERMVVVAGGGDAGPDVMGPGE